MFEMSDMIANALHADGACVTVVVEIFVAIGEVVRNDPFSSCCVSMLSPTPGCSEGAVAEFADFAETSVSVEFDVFKTRKAFQSKSLASSVDNIAQ